MKCTPLENTGKMVLLVCRHFQRRGSRCILGSGNIVEKVKEVTPEKADFWFSGSDVFVKSYFSLSHSFTLDTYSTQVTC